MSVLFLHANTAANEDEISINIIHDCIDRV